MKNKSSMFISFEGIDGSGKSTLARVVYRILNERGINALHIDRRHPQFSDEYVAQKAKELGSIIWPKTPGEPQYILGDTHFLLISTAWLRMIQKHIIEPALDKGLVVIMDGWYAKLISRNLLRTHVSKTLISSCRHELIDPDLLYFLQIDPQIAADRKCNFSNAEAGINDGLKGGADGFIEYQGKFQASLKRELTSHLGDLMFVDANVPVEQLALRVTGEIEMRMSSKTAHLLC